MKLANVIKGKKYRKRLQFGYVVRIFNDYDFEIAERILKLKNSRWIRAWNSKEKCLEMLKNLNIPITQREKNLRTLSLKLTSQRMYCFEYNGFLEILIRTPALNEQYVAKEYSKKMNQLVIAFGIYVNKSRLKKYKNTFSFSLYICNSRKTLTQGFKNYECKKDSLPSAECLNMALNSNVTQKDLEDLWQIDRADKFVPQLEKLFNVKIIYDDKVIDKEFDCIKNKEWYGIYKYKNE